MSNRTFNSENDVGLIERNFNNIITDLITAYQDEMTDLCLPKLYILLPMLKLRQLIYVKKQYACSEN